MPEPVPSLPSETVGKRGHAIRLLLVEDLDSDAELFGYMLAGGALAPEPVLARARDIATARRLIHEHRPDCVLLDLGLPDAAGLSGLQALRAESREPAIIMLTGRDDDALALAAVGAGAQDYIVKDHADGAGIARAIGRALQRHSLLAEVARQQHDAGHVATHDALTGLANRRGFEGHLAALWNGPDGRGVVVILLDLDGFKPVNDRYGHGAGDELLVEVARRLHAFAGPQGIAARLGGDEFALVPGPEARAAGVPAALARLREQIEAPLVLGGHTLAVSASIGIARLFDDGADSASVLAAADGRMYADKFRRRTGSVAA